MTDVSKLEILEVLDDLNDGEDRKCQDAGHNLGDRKGYVVVGDPVVHAFYILGPIFQGVNVGVFSREYVPGIR